MSAAEEYPAAYLSEWAANGINVAPREKMTYNGRRWMPAMFDTQAQRRVCKMSRQVGKSTFGSAFSLMLMANHRRFNVLYAAPEQDQTSKYSWDKVAPMIAGSPGFDNIIGVPNNVFEKKFANTESKYYLKWAKHNPDACRGLTVDMVHYDEVQDQTLDEIEPVINEAMFTSEHEKLLYTGTPKSLVNPIHGLWKKSDQREWVITCGGCSKYVNLGIKNIGKHGPICHHCGKILDVDNGQWIRHNRASKMAGFHVHQMHCKISYMKLRGGIWVPNQNKWDSILKKFEDYPRPKFLNEVLGMSADTADVPITEAMLRRICGAHKIVEDPPSSYMRAPIYAGIDWGRGPAATVLTLGQFYKGKFRFLYLKKFKGDAAHPQYCIPKILQTLKTWRVARVHCDHGMGFGMNSQIAEGYGDNRVTACYYSSSAKSADYTWKTKNKEVPCLTLNKSNAVSAFIERIRKRHIVMPRQEEFFDEFSEDFLNVRAEVDRHDNLRYLKAEGENDDAFHAALYCYVIANFDTAGSKI